MSLFENKAPRPLADRLRPSRIAEVVGQDHLLGPAGPVGRMLATGRLSSCRLWVRPGCGRPTVARLLAAHTNLSFVVRSTVLRGAQDYQPNTAPPLTRRTCYRGQ